MFWDPEVESPATIAVIGAGPVGIEAALYARFLGYDVDIFDAGRPGRSVVRWHRRSLGVHVRDCTTSLGHAALRSQDDTYSHAGADQLLTGQEFAERYLLPLAKSDLLVDHIHINSEVIEVSRLRTSMEDQVDLQERCNDEFRILIRSRDRGTYTRRADIVLDCRGAMAHTCGWGPAGSQSIVSAEALEHLYRWLPGDPRFEIRDVQGKQTILFGQSELALRFAIEWQQQLDDSSASHIADSLRRMTPVQQTSAGVPAQLPPQELDLKLVWLIPNVSLSTDANAIQIAEELSKKVSDPKRFSYLTIRGIERATRDTSGRWTLELLLADDSTVELSGDTFAPFPNARPTHSIGKELRSHELAFRRSIQVALASDQPTFYADWPGWQVATEEPQYYRLGSIEHPNDPKGLPEAYRQIRDLFAMLGGRENLNLYEIV
jgi:hypothetical protein